MPPELIPMVEVSAVLDEVLFLFPLVYRPLKESVIKRFARLSQWYCGHAFALSGSRLRDVALSGFRFHSERVSDSSLARLARGIWIQVVVPLRLLLGRARVRVVVAYDPFRCGIAAVLLKYAFRCKMIVEVNGEFHSEYERNEPGQSYVSVLLKTFLLRLSLRCADAVKVLNRDQEAYFRGRFPEKRIFRFPGFVPTQYFESLTTHQGNYLLSVGYPFHRKGMDVLIKAFKLVAAKHPQVGLKIMGHCPEGELTKIRELAGGHRRIEFVPPGWIEDVGELMRGCYALVNAARSEGMGRVHVEAMACGKPIVATRTNGAMECVEDGQTGLLCEIEDVGDLAAKLDSLLSNPDRAAQMGRAGKIRMQILVSEKFTSDKFRAMLDEVIQGEAALVRT